MTTFATVLAQHYVGAADRPAIHLQFARRDDVTLTYRDLVCGAAGFARVLAERGIAPGEVVVIILQHGEPLVYAFWGATLHGAVPSILPPLTEKLLPERYRKDLAALIRVTRPRAIVTYAEFAPEVTRAANDVGGDAPQVIVIGEVVPTEPDFAALGGMRRSPQDIVLLQHSSGSTGLQKGVALSHRAVFNQLDAYAPAIGLSDRDVIVSWLPLYHDMGLIASFVLPVLRRVPLVLMSPFDWVRAPARLMHAVTKYGGTLTWLPNFAYNFCATRIRERDLTDVDLSSLRAVINCSEPIYHSSHQIFLQKFERYGLRPNALATCYAMAENTFAVTQSEIGRPIARNAGGGIGNAGQVSSGRPLSNVRIRILSEDRRDLPEGAIGEIALQSDCMLSEYYHRPDATAQAFFEGFYLTGDLGYVLDGEVYVTGRKKDLIIVGGKNVYPQDLEQLASEVPGVHPGRVAAFGVFNAEAGTEDVVIVAEAESEDVTEREQVAEAIRQHITRNSDVAVRRVVMVDARWLIKTSSGKVARSANKEKYLAQLCGGEASSSLPERG
ncbi:MAG: AMP-binding protein [Thermoflexales bacterium]|nr:AMP-binding protein [Thermoflexales bacterium]MDW8351645.1 AMP-binding protein [Anaerolineae bacterium]